jgi:phage terminase large subunit-like protein
MVLSACETGVGEARPWVQAFVEQCSIFPSGKYDDQVDRMSQALNRLRGTVSMPKYSQQMPRPPTGDRGWMA